MSAQPPTTPRIEDLRARLRLDPKARHFYPLAEELRKLGQLEESEKILREGITHHPTYLSAWVSLGRVLAEKGSHHEAIEALTKALALDPGNVVCANLLVASYLAVGEKVEALKKLKLVRAVMPGDEVEEQIAALEKEIAGGAARPAGFAPAATEPPPAAPEPLEAQQQPAGAEVAPTPVAAAETASEVAEAVPEPSPIGTAATQASYEGSPPKAREPRPAEPSAEPSAAAPSWETPAASPFLAEADEEPAPGGAPLPPEAADVLPEEVFAAPTEPEHSFGGALEETVPMEAAASPREAIEEAVPESTPLIAAEEGPEPFPSDEPAVVPEEPALAAEERAPSEAEEPPASPAAIADDQTATLTMAELYAKQGHDAAARDIYERVLERDPSNEDVRERLAALSGTHASPEREKRHAAAARLERWLEKVGRRGL
ncbi:MAG TPA: tetratricopeptide repeat protein [Thermoanaerobaculia bacterium]